MHDTIHITATDEATVGAALAPVGLCSIAEDGVITWTTSAHRRHALQVLPPPVLVPAQVDPDTLEMTAPPVLATGWHAVVTVYTDHSDHAAIVAACAPFAGGEP